MLQLLNAPTSSTTQFSEKEDRYFTNTVQSKEINWHELYDEISVMEQELSDNEETDFDWEPYWSYMYDCESDENARLSSHKRPFFRRFRRHLNKSFIPLRRYGNSFDGWEKRRNDSPNMFKTYRDALSLLQKQELTEPLQVLQHSTLKAAKNDLRQLGYVFNWRKSMGTHLAENNKHKHALCESETGLWAYSENPYGKHGIEPDWRKILVYSPDSYALQQEELTEQRKTADLEKQFVYDWKTRTHSLPTPTKPTAKSSRITVQAHGCGGGGIRTLHN